MSTQSKVSVGVTTYAGYSGTLAGVILAVYAYSQGDRTAGTVGTIAAGVAFAITQVWRYAQAVVLAKQAKLQSSGAVGVATTSANVDDPVQVSLSGTTWTQALDRLADGPQDSVASVAAEEAELPSDDEELQNVPVPDSAQVPVAPAGEPPTDLPLPPPLESGDAT